MAGTSRNGFDLIRATFAKLKGKWCKAFLATVIMVAPLMLCSFTVYGLVAAVLLFGVFQVGYIRYMRALIDDQNPSFALIFSEFNEPWMEIFLGSILISLYVVGGVLFVIPGVIMVALFSMSMFLAEYKKSKTPVDAMKNSAKYMRGSYTHMFAYKVLFWLVYIVLLLCVGIGVVFVVKLWANYKVWSILLLVLLYVATTVVWSLITMYYHVANELFFRELLLYANHREQENNKDKKVVIIEEENSEPVVEEKTVEEKPAQVKKPAVRKTTTAKKTAPKTTEAKATAVKKASEDKPVKKTTTKKTTK